MSRHSAQCSHYEGPALRNTKATGPSWSVALFRRLALRPFHSKSLKTRRTVQLFARFDDGSTRVLFAWMIGLCLCMDIV